MTVQEILLIIAGMFRSFPRPPKEGMEPSVGYEHWANAYVAQLTPYNGPVLHAAWQKVLRERRSVAFPTPAEIEDACRAVQNQKPTGPAVETTVEGLMSYVNRRQPEMVAEWWAGHAPTAEQARAGGWWATLDFRMRRRAFYVAQLEYWLVRRSKPPSKQSLREYGAILNHGLLALVVSDEEIHALATK